MEKTEFNEIKFLELINEIKATIKNSGFPIDYQKSYEIDQKIKPIVEAMNKKDGILPEDFKEIEKGIGNRIRTLYFYYFALYQDNMDLLKVLSEQDLNWNDESIRDSLFLLDKRVSSLFSLKHYLFLVNCSRSELFNSYEEVNSTIPNPRVNHDNKKALIKEMNLIYQKLFQNNTLSIEDKEVFLQRLKEISLELKNYRIDFYSEEEKERAYKNLSKILTVSPFVCKKKEDFIGRTTYNNLLSPYVMEIFGVQGVLDLKDKQKEIISQIDCRNKKVIQRVKEFIEKYPNYQGNIRFHKDLLDNLSNEEIANLTEQEEKVYEKAISINSCKRVKELLKQGFSFDGKLELINPTIMSILTNEEILGLSEKDILKIKRIIQDGSHLAQVEESSLQDEIKRVATKKGFFEKMKKRIF